MIKEYLNHIFSMMNKDVPMEQIIIKSFKEAPESLQVRLREVESRVESKMCFKNAANFVVYSRDHDSLIYCEGYCLAANTVPIPHAWIGIKTDTGYDYYDPTAEVLWKEIPSEYVLIKSYTFKECVDEILENKTWGPWSPILFLSVSILYFVC